MRQSSTGTLALIALFLAHRQTPHTQNYAGLGFVRVPFGHREFLSGTFGLRCHRNRPGATLDDFYKLPTYGRWGRVGQGGWVDGSEGSRPRAVFSTISTFQFFLGYVE